VHALDRLQTRQHAAVYVLQRFDRRRFKVGWSVAPLKRIRLLPEFNGNQLDLDASRVLWLPSRKRAEQVEDAVHKCLAPYAAQAGHHLDGHSEWFQPAAHPMALSMLSQVPLDERSRQRARLVPLQLETPLAKAVSIKTSAQDAWWALEDLWLRVAMHCPIEVERDGDVHRVVIVGFRRAWDGPMASLRHAVMNADTYRWEAAGRHNEFVKLIDYRADDLVCTLATLRQIGSWPDGTDLVWQVKGFLLRLRRGTSA
jgi:hypothetical protein